MKKVLKNSFEAGSQESHEPCLLGSIVEKELHGNSPLAKGYRQYIASQDNGEAEEQGWHTNTDLGVDVKTILSSGKRMKTGREYQGTLRRDSDGEADEFFSYDAHYTFVESLPSGGGKRHPRVFEGRYITITRRDDGALRPNFRAMEVGSSFTVDGYAIGVMEELRRALTGLAGKER